MDCTYLKIRSPLKRWCLTFGLAVWGAAGFAAAESDFYFDYGVTYPREGGAVRLSIYYAIPLDRLTATPAEAGARLYRFNVGARLERKADGVVVADKYDTRSDVVSAADEYRTPLSIGELELEAPAGEYNLSLGIGDLNTGQPSVETVEVVLPAAPASGAYLSDIELANAVAPAEPGDTGQFLKSGLTVLPNPTKVVSDRESSLSLYIEAYRIPAETEYAFLFEIVQVNGKRFYSLERSLDEASGNIARAETLDISGIPPGPYELKVTLLDDRHAAIFSVTKSFAIYHEYDADELAALRGKFMPFSLDEEKQVRREIALVATPAELAAYDALPAEEKPIFVDNFWSRRDSNKSTPENEFKNAFYARYRYAQEHFSTAFREGIDTDRGRIYLKFGEPDRIEYSPMGARSESTFEGSTWQSKGFEAWEYDKPGGVDNQYVLFVFEDSDGDGNFELDSSTVPGYGKLIRTDVPNGQ